MGTSQETIRLIAVVNKLGVHARPSAMLVQLANQFKADLFVSREGEAEDDEVNAKSIMGVMMLAAACGTILRFRAVGDDNESLLDALDNLFLSKFTEE